MSPQNSSTYFQTNELYTEFVVAQSLLISINVFAISISSITLIAYIRHKTMWQVDCVHLIASLALCDFLGGFGGVVLGLTRLRIVLFNYYDYSRLYCISTAVVWLVALDMSHVIIGAIAMDRLLAITSPYSERNNRTYAKYALIVALVAALTILPLSVMGVDFKVQPDRCTWIGSVSALSANTYLLFNSLIGPVVAVIYAFALCKMMMWRKNLVVNRNLDTAQSDQAKITKLMTKLVCIYFILVSIPLVVLCVVIETESPSINSTSVGYIVNICLSINSSVNFFFYATPSSGLRPFICSILKCGKSNVIRVSP